MKHNTDKKNSMHKIVVQNILIFLTCIQILQRRKEKSSKNTNLKEEGAKTIKMSTTNCIVIAKMSNMSNLNTC